MGVAKFGTAAVVALLALSACASGSDALPPVSEPSVTGATAAPKKSTAPAPATTPAPPPSEDPGMIPLAPHRAPTEFTGDEAEFVRQVRGTLAEEKADATMSDSRLLTLGREFCSVLSGGGLLTDKVDHWVVFRELKKGVDDAIVLAAQAVFCADLTENYSRLQLSELAEPTTAERADLARFITTMDQPSLEKKVESITDHDLAGDANAACELNFKSEWWNSSAAGKLEDGLGEQGRMAYVVGLVTAFCPDDSDDMIDSLEDWAR